MQPQPGGGGGHVRLLVAFSEGASCAEDTILMPEIARQLSAACKLEASDR